MKVIKTLKKCDSWHIVLIEQKDSIKLVATNWNRSTEILFEGEAPNTTWLPANTDFILPRLVMQTLDFKPYYYFLNVLKTQKEYDLQNKDISPRVYKFILKQIEHLEGQIKKHYRGSK